MASDKTITAFESGKIGGSRTLQKYGKEYFKNLANKRFEGMTKEQISEYMKRVSHSRASVKNKE